VDKDTALRHLAAFREALARYGIVASQIVLFGSYARGDWHEGSDIDVIVISPDFAGKDYWQRIDAMARAICDVWQPIESIAMTPEEWERGDSMIAQIARESGEVVYPAKVA